MIEELQSLLGIEKEQPRVMRVTKQLSNALVRVDADGVIMNVTGGYAVDTDLLVSGGNVVMIVPRAHVLHSD